MHHRSDVDRAQISLRRSRVLLATIAAAVLCCAAAAAAAPAVREAPRIAIKSGTPQTARVWVAARANRYETKFDAALVVNVAPDKTKVRFRCITRGCEFPPADQPDTVTRVDGSAFDVLSAKGTAAITLTIWTVTPEDVVVVAQPAERNGPQVRFLLKER
jgi:hypothetical protein